MLFYVTSHVELLLLSFMIKWVEIMKIVVQVDVLKLLKELKW